MFCRNCGKEIAESAEICIHCGVRVPYGNKFCHICGAETLPQAEICVKCGAGLRKSTTDTSDVSDKSRLATVLLAWFLGHLGIHRFYIGKTGTGVVMLILGVLGWLTVWFFGIGLLFLIPVGILAFINFIIAITGNMKDGEGKIIKNW